MEAKAETGRHWADLDRALDRLRENGREASAFCRDDDVDEDEESLRALIGIFAERRIPLNLAVIPGRLTAEGAALLRRWRDRHPDLIGIDQHGFRHVNHESVGRKCEFGASRSFEDQRRDIAEGRARLVAEFGADVSPVFVPPWNRCAAETRRALVDLGFRAISGWKDKKQDDAGPGDALLEVPATLDPYSWKRGAELKPEGEVIADLIAQLESGATIGLMFHHKVMDEAARNLTARVLDALSASRVVRFYLFEDLLLCKDVH